MARLVGAFRKTRDSLTALIAGSMFQRICLRLAKNARSTKDGTKQTLAAKVTWRYLAALRPSERRRPQLLILGELGSLSFNQAWGRAVERYPHVGRRHREKPGASC